MTISFIYTLLFIFSASVFGQTQDPAAPEGAPMARITMQLDESQFSNQGVAIRFPGVNPSPAIKALTQTPVIITGVTRDSSTGHLSFIINEGTHKIDFNHASVPTIERSIISAQGNRSTFRYVYQPFEIEKEVGLFILKLCQGKQGTWYVADPSLDAMWISQTELQDVASRLDDVGSDDTLVALLISHDYQFGLSTLGTFLMATADFLRDAAADCCADPNTAMQTLPPPGGALEGSTAYTQIEEEFFAKQLKTLTDLLDRRNMLESYTPEFRQAIVEIVFQQLVAVAISQELGLGTKVAHTTGAVVESGLGFFLVRNHRPLAWIKSVPVLHRLAPNWFISGKPIGFGQAGIKGFLTRWLGRAGAVGGVVLFFQAYERMTMVYQYELDPGVLPLAKPFTISAETYQQASQQRDTLRPFQKKSARFFEAFKNHIEAESTQKQK